MSLEIINEGRNCIYFPTPEWGWRKVPAVRFPAKIITFRFTPVCCQNPHMWFLLKNFQIYSVSKIKYNSKHLRWDNFFPVSGTLYILGWPWAHHHSAFPCWALRGQAYANTLSKARQMLLKKSLEFMPIQDFLENYFITDIVKSNKFRI